MVSSSPPVVAAPSNWHAAITAPYAIAAVLLLAIFGTSPNFKRASGADQGLLAGDFLQEWIGGHIVRIGDHARLYDTPYAIALEHDPRLVGFVWDEHEYLPMVYPPFWYQLLSPLSALPYPVAASLWAVLMMLTILVSCVLLRRWVEAGGRATNGPASGRTNQGRLEGQLGLWWLPLAMVFPPVIENLTSGQKGGWCLLLMTATGLLLSAGRARTAGAVFGLLLFKPQLTLVVVPLMIWRREWRFLLGFGSVAALLGLVSLSLGATLCSEYIRFLSGAADYVNTAGYDLEKSHSVYGAMTLFLVRTGCQFGGGARLAAGAAIITILVVMVWFLRRPWTTPNPASTPRLAVELATMTLATLLVSPHLFTYDLTLLLFPCATLLRADVRDWLGTRWRPVAWTAAGLLAVCGVSPALAARTGVQLTTLLMGALWLALVSRRSTEEEPDGGNRQTDPDRQQLVDGEPVWT